MTGVTFRVNSYIKIPKIQNLLNHYCFKFSFFLQLLHFELFVIEYTYQIYKCSLSSIYANDRKTSKTFMTFYK